ncbi:MAG TPA: TIGR02444 family protein [Lacipirellulaceae bacterium]|nr:TIGR02444 family protein [Lacipirellulaceae bacterium]
MSNARDNNPLWRFSLDVYAAPGVSSECLDLQDRHGLDVNILLFVVWLGVARGLTVSPAHLEQLNATVTEWQRDVVCPVRAVRRRVKSLGRSDLYEEIKTLELKLEWAEQSMLFALASVLDGQKTTSNNAVAANASLYAASKGAPAPRALIAAAVSRV